MDNHKKKMTAPIVVTILIICYYGIYFGILVTLFHGICNRDGLYSYDIIKEIDDKQSAYDNTEERRMLEQTAHISRKTVSSFCSYG